MHITLCLTLCALHSSALIPLFCLPLFPTISSSTARRYKLCCPRVIFSIAHHRLTFTKMDTSTKHSNPPPHIPANLREQNSSSSSQPSSDEVTFAHREQRGSHSREKDEERLGQSTFYPYHAEHGPPIDNALKYDEAEADYRHHSDLWWSRVRHHLRDPFAEFLGTFIMILFGDGSVAQVVLSANPNLPKSSQNKGDYQSISWG